MDWQLPEGGFDFRPRLIDGLQADHVWRTAVYEGVAVNRGGGFSPAGHSEEQRIRIAFPWTPEDQFPEAARRLRLACERVANGDAA